MNKLHHLTIDTGEIFKSKLFFYCSRDAQLLWFKLLLQAHDSNRYGYIVSQGKQIPHETLAKGVGLSLELFRSSLTELLQYDCLSCLRDGTIFFPKLVDSERLKNIRKKAGQIGGKQTACKSVETVEMEVLLKQNSSKHPSKTQANTLANDVANFPKEEKENNKREERKESTKEKKEERKTKEKEENTLAKASEPLSFVEKTKCSRSPLQQANDVYLNCFAAMLNVDPGVYPGGYSRLSKDIEAFRKQNFIIEQFAHFREWHISDEWRIKKNGLSVKMAYVQEKWKEAMDWQNPKTKLTGHELKTLPQSRLESLQTPLETKKPVRVAPFVQMYEPPEFYVRQAIGFRRDMIKNGGRFNPDTKNRVSVSFTSLIVNSALKHNDMLNRAHLVTEEEFTKNYYDGFKLALEAREAERRKMDEMRVAVNAKRIDQQSDNTQDALQ